MDRLKTIVVEDERLPRLTLLSKLEDYRERIDVVDACDSYESALESIFRHRPDLLFLDIQLQRRDSIQLLDELQRTIPLPYIIFTTAYSDRNYLMSAIKFSAVDYLLKPVGKGELAHAIAKAIDRASARGGDKPAILRFKSGNGVLFSSPDDIAGFKAAGNYSILKCFSGEDLILESLLSLERRLPAGFARVDRSTIINTSRIHRLDQQRHTCTLQSPDGHPLELPFSKTALEALLALM